MITRTILALAMLFMQTQQTPDDTPEYQGQPLSCDNYSTTAHKCACGKAMHSDCMKQQPSVRNDSKCATNCRPEHCHCVNKCTS